MWIADVQHLCSNKYKSECYRNILVVIAQQLTDFWEWAVEARPARLAVVTDSFSKTELLLSVGIDMMAGLLLLFSIAAAAWGLFQWRDYSAAYIVFALTRLQLNVICQKLYTGCTLYKHI